MARAIHNNSSVLCTNKKLASRETKINVFASTDTNFTNYIIYTNYSLSRQGKNSCDWQYFVKRHYLFISCLVALFCFYAHISIARYPPKPFVIGRSRHVDFRANIDLNTVILPSLRGV